MTGEPPSEDGAFQLTVAEEAPLVAKTPVGAPGSVIGVTAFRVSVVVEIRR